MAHYESRSWSDGGQTYQVYVPDLMQDRGHCSSLVLQQQLAQLNQHQIGLEHQRFFLRYLAGNVSLREGTVVSHKQLALVSAGIPLRSVVANTLWSQMHLFEQGLGYAKKLFSGSQGWQVDSLLTLHRKVSPEVASVGQFRKGMCWIGGKNPVEARFVAAAPEHIEGLMADWLSYVNRYSPLSLEQVLMNYDQLLVIHPFSDGNGRVSRVFMDSGLSQLRSQYWLHPLFFRLASGTARYINAHNAYQRDELDQWLCYWEDAFTWLVKKQIQIASLLDECERAFQNMLSCTSKPEHWDKLKYQLYISPIITMDTAHRYAEAVTVMLQRGGLEVKHIAAFNNQVVLECPLVFELWQQWENVIFAKDIDG